MNVIDVLDARFQPKGRIQADHQSSLGIEGCKIPMEFRLNGEIAHSLLVIKMGVVTDKSVMRLPPEIGLRICSNNERFAFLFPGFGFVEPDHGEIVAPIK